MRKTAFFFVFFAFFVFTVFPDGGLLMPDIDSIQYDELKKKGLELTREEIYNEDNISLKDAVVLFGKGATGVIVSNDGLILTNHHCGLRFIEKHSSSENNYLENGFLASSRDIELPNENLTIQFLKKTINVTNFFSDSVRDVLPETERKKIINEKTKEVRNLFSKNYPEYIVDIKPLYDGNQYVLSLYEEFQDIRLVYAPPMSIGKYGGELDNWIWPRYTGDFALFRIYANNDNKPAKYSKDNIPYKPNKVVSITTKGITEGEFSMVIGFPGRTHNLITSDFLSLVAESELPFQIELLNAQLNVLSEYSKYNTTTLIHSKSNFKKKLQGIVDGVNSTSAVLERRKEEYIFKNKINNSYTLSQKYGSILDKFYENYEQMRKYTLIYSFYRYGISDISIFNIIEQYKRTGNNEDLKVKKEFLKAQYTFFENYYPEIDKKIFCEMFKIYLSKIPEDFHIPAIKNLNVNEIATWVDNLYNETPFTSYAKLEKALIEDKYIVEKDPLVTISDEISEMLNEKVWSHFPYISYGLDSLYKAYTKAKLDLLEIENSRNEFWPNANGGMRVSVGKITGYENQCVKYNFQTTLGEVFEKYSNSEKEDYIIPKSLKTQYENNDNLINMPICFISNCHTTSGNSGSPVFNAKGELIGLNFDRNWEGTMSDYFYNEELCRNISVDCRYILFILKEIAKADDILNELIIK